MALEAAVLASRALGAPTPAWALLAISVAPCGQQCPSRVLPLRAQVAPMSQGTALPEPENVPACSTRQWLSWPMATVLQQQTCEGLGHTREGKGSSGKRVVETNIMVGHQRGFSSARAMVQLSHSITCEVHNPGWGPLQISAITILPHPLTSKHQYQGKLRRAVRKLRPGERSHV